MATPFSYASNKLVMNKMNTTNCEPNFWKSVKKKTNLASPNESLSKNTRTTIQNCNGGLTFVLFLLWSLFLVLLTSFQEKPGGRDTLAMACWHIYTVGSE